MAYLGPADLFLRSRRASIKSGIFLLFLPKVTGVIPSKDKLQNPNLSNLVPRQASLLGAQTHGKGLVSYRKDTPKFSQLLSKILWMCNLKYLLSIALIFLCLTLEKINQIEYLEFQREKEEIKLLTL